MLLLSSSLFGQSKFSQSTVRLSSVADNKVESRNLLKTNDQLFLANIYTISKVISGRNQHWFLKLADHSGTPLNFARIKLSGYLRDDKEVQFNYSSPIVSLGKDGKYIIQSVQIPQSGTWVFKAIIDDEQQTDAFVFETRVY